MLCFKWNKYLYIDKTQRDDTYKKIIFMAIKLVTVTSVGFVTNFDVSEQYNLSIYIGAL